MSDLKWEKLSTTYLIQKPWATLRVDSCKMPDGTVIPDYYVLEYPEWVNAVALTEDGKFILIRQYRHAANEVILELPGGCVEKGENPELACRRELLEETGYEFDSLELVSTLFANPATANNKTYCYLARGGKLTSDQKLDRGEEIQVELYSNAELKEILHQNKLPHALHASGVFYAMLQLAEKP